MAVFGARLSCCVSLQQCIYVLQRKSGLTVAPYGIADIHTTTANAECRPAHFSRCENGESYIRAFVLALFCSPCHYLRCIGQH
jgi:hypothetical protein